MQCSLAAGHDARRMFIIDLMRDTFEIIYPPDNLEAMWYYILSRQ
jgi:hypothetical protein